MPRRGRGENARGMNSPCSGNRQGAMPHSPPGEHPQSAPPTAPSRGGHVNCPPTGNVNCHPPSERGVARRAGGEYCGLDNHSTSSIKITEAEREWSLELIGV